MSTTSHPITPQSFSLALEPLPLSNLYAKAAELQNSIVHLLRSNRELKEYSDSVASTGTGTGTESSNSGSGSGGPVGGTGGGGDGAGGGRRGGEGGDQDCLDAIVENEEVIKRMVERIELVREEVERRGARWINPEEEAAEGEGSGGGGVDRGDEVGATTMGNGVVNGDTGEVGGHHVNGGSGEVVNGYPNPRRSPRQPGGRLMDEELQRQLAQRLGDEDEDDGVHL